MRNLLTPAQMSEMERTFFAQTGVKSIDLMERAASEVAKALIQRFGPDKRVFFACGSGGNGGDGLAAARLYQQAGGKSAILLSRPPRTPDAQENYRRAREAGVGELSPEGSEFPEIWVDALLGIGLSRPVEGMDKALIERMRSDVSARRSRAVVAVDIPSGVDGKTGAVLGCAANADLTVTFQSPKLGHVLGEGIAYTGELLVRDIGIPARFLPDAPRLYTPGDIPRDPFPRVVHKGIRGHVLLVAGSVGMAGAAALAAGAALRSGAGLVTIACPQSIVPILQILEPCAMCAPLPEKDGALAPEALEPLCALFPGKKAIAIGPGISRRCSAQIVEAVLRSDLPAVIDADALNKIALTPSLADLLRPRHILTPHPGEAARLLQRSPGDPFEDASQLGAMGEGCCVVLKGASRVIYSAPEGALSVSATGGSGMAKGGSGDVFTGVLAGFLARGIAQPALACELHGLAGVLAERKCGNHGMTAQNIVEMLPEAFLRAGEFA